MRKKNILIVDDNVTFSQGLARLLENKGYNAYMLNKVDEAIEIMDSVIPDAVIVDIIMPERYGYELINHIKTEYVNIPVIAISGGSRNLPTKYYLDFAEALRADRILKKPFEVNDLIDIIEKFEPIYIADNERKNRK